MTVSSANGSSLYGMYSSLYASANGGSTGPIELSAPSSSSSGVSALVSGGSTKQSSFQTMLRQYNSYNTMNKSGIFAKFASMYRANGGAKSSTSANNTASADDIVNSDAYKNAVAAYKNGAMNPNASIFTAGMLESIAI